jgi:hypothetical protein
MTASTNTEKSPNTIDRALASLRVTRQPDESTKPDTVVAKPGYFTDLAQQHAKSGHRHSG